MVGYAVACITNDINNVDIVLTDQSIDSHNMKIRVPCTVSFKTAAKRQATTCLKFEERLVI